jgi:anti-sigma factor RsiW
MEDGTHVIDLLTEYLEGALGPDERQRVVRHLSDCPDCSRALHEIQDVIGQARSLPDRVPARDLWPAIEAELTARSAQPHPGSVVPLASRRRDVRLSVPQAIAAGLALMLASGAGVWTLRPAAPLGGDAERSVTIGSPSGIEAETPVPVELVADVIPPEVSDELARLEREFVENSDRLEASTVRVIERNLGIIDRAIAESVVALRSDPGSAFFREHLDAAVRRKAEYLRRAVVGPMRSS